MYTESYLCQLGELTLKGGNLKTFEKRLVDNTRSYLSPLDIKIQLRAGRMYIDCRKEDSQAVEFCLSRLIGITGWAKTQVVDKNLDAIKEAVMREALFAKERGAKTFKIETRRSDKSFPLNSYELSAQAASDVHSQAILQVNLHKPDLIIRIEVREKCFVYGNAHKAPRGLPVGVSNKGLLLLSGGIDSPVAGYRMMRRGMKVESIYFHAYPYTSTEAQEKVEELARKLSLFGLETALNIIHFTEVQLKIRQQLKEIPTFISKVDNKEKKTEAYSTLLLRFCMMKTASLLADYIHASCLISGESLGQVASQTIENLAITEAASPLPLLRPLIGLDKEEIVETARYIDSYETSILPYEDCCVLFSPKHPVLKAHIEDVLFLYEALKVDALIQEAFEKREIKIYRASDSIRKMLEDKNQKN